MAKAFKIQTAEKSDTLILRVSGEIDGSSALELSKHLEDHVERFSRVVIDLQRLSSVHPFGRAVFEKAIRRCCLRQGWRLNFEGQNQNTWQMERKTYP
jgi:anti-anti-sigma factor